MSSNRSSRALIRTALVATAISTTSTPAVAEEPAAAETPTWPDYRGPTRDGQAPAANVPLEWSESHNVRWKTAVHGVGWSSPVVADGTAWMTTASEDGSRMSVVAVDVENGDVVHDAVMFQVEAPEHKNALNSYASPSPAIEAGWVYVHFGTYGTACLDASTGAIRWVRRDLHCDHMEGPGSSPLLWGDQLILHMDGGDVQYVVALDKETGETRWKTDRTVKLGHLPPDLRKAYSTPIVVDADGRDQLISPGAQAAVAYDLATGEELWTVRYKGFSMSSRPLVHEGHVLLNTGFMKAQLWAVRLGGEGDVTDSHVAWRHRGNVPQMSSPVIVDGRLYMVDDSGVASCVDAKTGDRIWRERIGGQHCASPVVAGGRLYFFDREGKTVVLAPGPEFDVLAENKLDAGFMASPAVVGDALLLRTKTHLYRVESTDIE